MIEDDLSGSLRRMELCRSHEAGSTAWPYFASRLAIIWSIACFCWALDIVGCPLGGWFLVARSGSGGPLDCDAHPASVDANANANANGLANAMHRVALPALKIVSLERILGFDLYAAVQYIRFSKTVAQSAF